MSFTCQRAAVFSGCLASGVVLLVRRTPMHSMLSRAVFPGTCVQMSALIRWFVLRWLVPWFCAELVGARVVELAVVFTSLQAATLRSARFCVAVATAPSTHQRPCPSSGLGRPAA
eukprot:4082310-Alexandrium_andersonii.AAC.1